MSMNYVERTGKIKYSSGLCDYTAEGIIHYDYDKIPCKIGYIEGTDRYTGERILKPSHLFIEKDGVTDKGNFYYKNTIDLSVRVDIACREEK